MDGRSFYTTLWESPCPGRRAGEHWRQGLTVDGPPSRARAAVEHRDGSPAPSGSLDEGKSGAGVRSRRASLSVRWTRCPCKVGVLFLREQMGTSREGRFSNATEDNWTLPSSGERDLLGA